MKLVGFEPKQVHDEKSCEILQKVYVKYLYPKTICPVCHAKLRDKSALNNPYHRPKSWYARLKSETYHLLLLMMMVFEVLAFQCHYLIRNNCENYPPYARVSGNMYDDWYRNAKGALLFDSWSCGEVHYVAVTVSYSSKLSEDTSFKPRQAVLAVPPMVQVQSNEPVLKQAITRPLVSMLKRT